MTAAQKIAEAEKAFRVSLSAAQKVYHESVAAAKTAFDLAATGILRETLAASEAEARKDIAGKTYQADLVRIYKVYEKATAATHNCLTTEEA